MEKGTQVFLHKLLKSIGDAIITVFIPLYILKNSNIELAMGYLIIYSLFVLFYMFVLKKFIQKFGVLAMMLHFIPIIGAEAVLSFAPINIGTVIATAALMGLAQGLYSIPLNLVFTFGDKKTNVGKFMIATNIGKIVFTLVSGFILSSDIKNSFLILSIASTIFYIACIIPIIFAYKELMENYKKYKEVKLANGGVKPRIDKWFIIFHITFGVFQPIMDNVVPLYLYVNSLSFQSVTIVIVVVELLKVIANTISQILVKKDKAMILVILSAIVFITSITIMIFVKNSLVLYIFSCTASVSFPLTFVPMFGLYCKYLRNTENVFNGMTVRDIDIFSFRPALYALSYVGLGLIPCLIVGVGIVPFMLLSEIKLIKKDKQDKNLVSCKEV